MEEVSEFKFFKREQKPMIVGPLFLILTAMYTIAYNDDFRARSILWYGISVVVIGYLALIISSKYMKKPLGLYALWAGVFFCFSFLSGLWALDINPTLDTSKSLFLVFVVNILLSFVIETKEDIRNVLFANLFALGLYLLYVLLNVDLSQLGEDRLGAGTLGTMWNANDVGLKLCVGFTLSLYFGLDKQFKKWRVLFFAVAMVFAGVGLFTGSRKVFLMLIGIAVLFMFLYSKHKLIGIGIAVVSAIALYFAIMKIEPLYNILGERVQAMLEGLFGEGTTEGSFNVREEMIKLGWGWFLERPLFGYGMNNYRILYEQAMNWSTYSHNNFIETLINGGIVGFFLYYFIYGYIFVKLFKPAFFERDSMAILLFSVNLILLILQVALVSYYQTIFNCLLLLAVLYIQIKEKTHANS